MAEVTETGIVEPKLEVVEYWSLVGSSGVSAIYMVRIERGEKGQVLRNAIDNTPVEVQLLLRTDDDKNEVAGTLSFPVANLFSYGMERSTYAVYPKGHSPAEKAVADDIKRRNDGLVIRKRRMEAIIGGITDLNDGSTPPTE